jgi:Na+/H+ antiporter NhaD/arsenite permease-like protein
MTLYHIGIMAVYVTFSLLYYHAYSKREELSLNIVELHDTKESIVNSLFFVCLGLTGMLLIIIGGDEMAGLSGMIYPVIIAPFFSIMGAISRKKRDKLLAQLQAG